MMSYSDDLDWLARNVHEWPEHTPHIVTDGDSLFEFGAVFCKNHVRINMEDNSGKIFLKDRWVARRAELQEKAEPHPFTGLDEAIRKVLSVMRSDPEAFTPKELSEMRDICVAELAKLDTLEKRPDMHKNHEEIDASAERVQKKAESVHDWHERGELIEIIRSEYFDKDIDGGSLADAILAAGFRREGGAA